MKIARIVRKFAFGVYATVRCIIWPSKFARVADAYNASLPKTEPIPDPQLHAPRRVAVAFWFSWILTVGFASLGYAAGVGLKVALGPACTVTIKIVQVASAAILLAGALATRDWEIQTYGG